MYLDDIIIYSKTKEEHIATLRKVFQLLEENHLYVCLEKCDFLMDNLPFLGHVVTPNGLMADPDKTKAVEDMQPPTNVKRGCELLWLH